jgi:hypothetical protein
VVPPRTEGGGGLGFGLATRPTWRPGGCARRVKHECTTAAHARVVCVSSTTRRQLPTASPPKYTVAHAVIVLFESFKIVLTNNNHEM